MLPFKNLCKTQIINNNSSIFYNLESVMLFTLEQTQLSTRLYKISYLNLTVQTSWCCHSFTKVKYKRS